MKGKKQKGLSTDSETLKGTQGLLISAQTELLKIDGMLLTAIQPQTDEFLRYFTAIGK
jgi:hypothetical protein